MVNINPKAIMGPIADPAPEFIKWWIDELTAEQRGVIVQKEIDQQINAVKFQMQNMKMELEKLETMRSMIKVRGAAATK